MTLQEANWPVRRINYLMTLGNFSKRWLLGVCLLLMGVMMSEKGWGQIAAWNFYTGTTTSPATYSATTFDANLVSISGASNVTRGSSASASSASNSFRTTGFQNNGIAVLNTDYFQITLTAKAGYKLSLSTIDANLNGTASFAVSPGVSSQFAYSLDGTNFTLISSAQQLIGAPHSLSQISVAGISALQNVASSTTVTIRYYASGQTTTGGWGFYSASTGSPDNGLSIGGTVTTACISQTITGLPSTDSKTYGDASYALTASASSGLAVSYASSNTAVATVSGSNVTIVGAGTTTITASQAGNGTYCAASNVTQTLTVNKKDLTITGLTANNKTFDGTVAATLSGTATLSGVLASDAGNVVLGGTPTASFSDASVGTAKTVTVTGYTISGSASANYNLVQPTGLTADIAAAANSIDLSPATQAKGPYCNASANNVSLTYTTSGTVTAPLKIQLSNTSGTFVSGTTDLTGAVVTGSGAYTITASIPAGTSAGNLYRVRVLSADATPVSSLNNGSDITITAAVAPAVSISASPSSTICAGTSVTFTPAPTNGGTPSYTWWKNGIGTGTNLGSGTSLTTSTLVNGDVVAAVMTSTISCVSSSTVNSNNIIMTVTTPTPPGTITGSTTVCQGQNSVGYLVTNAASHTYTWSYTGSGYSGSSTTNSISGNYSTGATSGNITVTSTLSGCTSSASTLPITVNPLPTQPSAFTTSSSTVYFSQTGVAYTIPAVAGATSYSWSYSGTGATINGTGTSVTVDFSSSATSGTLSVFAVNACGNSTSARTIAIAVTPVNDLCSNAVSLVVGASAVSGTTVGATASSPFPSDLDVWYKFTPSCSGTASISTTTTGQDLDLYVYSSSCPSSYSSGIGSNNGSSTTTESITATVTAGTTYYIEVVNYSGTANTFSISVSPPPTAQPSTISGSLSPCIGVSTAYSVTSVSGVSYSWSLPSGWTGSSTTNSITVTPTSTSGTITVTPSNGCSTGTSRTSSTITPISTPATPGTITQPAAPICASSTGKTFSISSVSGASSYTWSVTGTGWSVTAGGTTTSATISIGSGAGTVSVTANNGCGSSTAQTTGSVTPVAMPADPTGSITPAANPACGSTSLSYSAASSSIYWQTAAIGTSVSSVTTSPLTISSSGISYVRAYNGSCWSTNSLASSTITINTQAAITVQPANKSVTSPTGTSFSVTATNATSYQWQEDAGSGWVNISNGGIYSGATTATLTLSATSETMDGNGYRVIVGAASSCVSVTSNAASLAVAQGPCLSEGFNSGIVAPSGWTFTNIGGTYASAGNFGASSPAIQMDATGDIVVTSALASAAASLTFWLKGQVTDVSSALLVEGWNGSSWVTIQNITNSIPTTGTTYTYNSGTSPALPAGLTQFRFSYTKSSGNLAFDDVTVSCTQICTSTATITSFLPATGPVGTWVTINGTNFTGATDVKFGGVSASSFTVVSSSTIKAKVPSTAINGSISITIGGCATSSSSSFSLISQTNCSSAGGSATGLFISEVYDAYSGSLGYIEIFNGTTSAVSLTNYTIRIRTGTSTDNDYPMSGTLAAGAVYILRVGTSSSGTCTGIAISNDQPTASGFNGNDQIFLLYNGSVIDYAPNPNATGAGGTNANAPGFSQVRKSTVTGPSDSYIASQWTNSSVESCSDLGVAPYVPAGNSVTINPGPSDYTGCTTPISFSATVTGSGANSPTYLWKVYNPLSNSWVDASDLSTASSFGLKSTITTGATNTTTMNVSGNVAQLQNYQFYLQVTRGSCVAASSAAQYLYDTRPYYRSNVASGNWSTPASWQISNDKVTWVSACSYPIASNSDEVEIQNGHTIALDLDIDIDKVTVTGTTGQLTINSSSKMTVFNSNTGADLIVNGVLQDDGSGGNGIDYATNASWILGSNGKVIKTNGGSSKYRDNYETGIVNIPATANWIYRISTLSPILYVAGGSSATTMYYPNLTIENTYGGNFASTLNANPDLSQFAFIGNNNGIIVKGNLNVGGSALNAGTVSISNVNTYAPLQVLGNTTIITGNTINNTGNASAAGGGFEFQGNLVNNGTLRSKLYAANGTSGKLWFTGGVNQTISGTGVFDLHNFRVNKTGSSTLTLATDILVPDSLTLVNGIVYTASSPNGLLTLGTTTNVVFGSPGTSAYINGPMAKQFAIGATTEFLYPIGKVGGYPTVYNPCYVVPTSITGATTTFTSEYFAGAQQAQGVMGTSVLGITNKEYWDITKSPSNTSSARVKLYYDNPGSGNWIYYTGASGSPYYTTAVDPCWYCNVAVVHKEGTTWNFTKLSNFSSSDPEYRFYTNDGWIYSATGTSFSPFTLAYSYNMILPVKLLSFTGRLQHADGKLEWKIADARDLDGFDLEYSRDGRVFQPLSSIPSNGSLSYGFLHKDLPAGTNYYRLLVKEKTGNTFYSQVVTLNPGKLVTYVIGISPANNGGQLNAVVYSASNQKLQASITDVLGRQIINTTKPLTQGTNQWNMQTNSLPKGLYFLTLRTDDGLVQTTRFMKG